MTHNSCTKLVIASIVWYFETSEITCPACQLLDHAHLVG